MMLRTFLIGGSAIAAAGAISAPARAQDGVSTTTIVIGGRPAGCPARYCGCGLRKYLGLDDVRLNVAWNWAKLFPRTHASSGAAAVRRGHVMLLETHVAGTRWIVRDYNGGNGLSYLHERDVRGFVFVNPNAQLAEAGR